MNELNVEFSNYIEEFRKLNTNTKRAELIKQIKDFIAVLTVIAEDDGLDVEFLKSKEILDLNKDFITEDDFLEATIVYLENAKNIVGQIFEKNM